MSAPSDRRTGEAAAISIICAVIVLLLILGSAAFGADVPLTWDAPTLSTDGTAIDYALTYRVYRLDAGAGRVLLAESATAQATVDAQQGQRTRVVVVAIGPGGESEDSAEYVIDLRKPGKPVNVRRAK